MKFKVSVIRIGYAFRSFVVDAENEVVAAAKAVDNAGDFHFSEKSSDYGVEFIEEIE